jgi:hypothetical protein
VEPDVAKPLDLTPELLLAGTRSLGQVVHDREGPGPLVALVTKLGLLEGDNGDRKRTDDGERALAHPVILFEAVVNGFAAPADLLARRAALPLLAMLILSDTIDVEMLLDRIGIVFFETGRSDHPNPSDTVREVVGELLDDMHTAGLTTGTDEQRLTDFGRRVALTGVRMRAMQDKETED